MKLENLEKANKLMQQIQNCEYTIQVLTTKKMICFSDEHPTAFRSLGIQNTVAEPVEKRTPEQQATFEYVNKLIEIEQKKIAAIKKKILKL